MKLLGLSPSSSEDTHLDLYIPVSKFQLQEGLWSILIIVQGETYRSRFYTYKSIFSRHRLLKGKSFNPMHVFYPFVEAVAACFWIFYRIVLVYMSVFELQCSESGTLKAPAKTLSLSSVRGGRSHGLLLYLGLEWHGNKCTPVVGFCFSLLLCFYDRHCLKVA